MSIVNIEPEENKPVKHSVWQRFKGRFTKQEDFDIKKINDYDTCESYGLLGIDRSRQPSWIWISPKYNKGDTVLEKKSTIFKIAFLIVAPTLFGIYLLNVLGIPMYFGVSVDPGFKTSLSMIVMALISSFTGASYGQAVRTPDNDNKFLQYFFYDFSGKVPKLLAKTRVIPITPKAEEKSKVTQIVLSTLTLVCTFVWILGGSDVITQLFNIPLKTDAGEFNTLTNLVLILVSLISGLASFSSVSSNKK